MGVSISFTPECWWFIQEARRWPALIPLPADLHALLDHTPEIEISGAVSEPRLIVYVRQTQAQAIQRWLQAMHDDLKHDDARRLKCLLCLSRVAVAITLSQK
jgi:hypothetical protein